jgi:hypothetical protein
MNNELIGDDHMAGLPIDGSTDLAATVRPYLGSVFGSHLHQIGHDSLFNLATALSAMNIGVSGRLTIAIPSRESERIEIDWQPTERTRVCARAASF